MKKTPTTVPPFRERFRVFVPTVMYVFLGVDPEEGRELDMQCPNCGGCTYSDSDALYCVQCGEPLPPTEERLRHLKRPQKFHEALAAKVKTELRKFHSKFAAHTLHNSRKSD